MPPTSVSSTSEEVQVESKTIVATVGGVPEIEEVASYGVANICPAAVLSPPRQLENSIAERTEVCVRRSIGNLRGTYNYNKAMGGSRRVESSSLLPQALICCNFP